MKKVRVRCNEGIAVSASYKQRAVDVWLTFKARPGRTVYHYAPTLISRGDLVHSVEGYKLLAEHYPGQGYEKGDTRSLRILEILEKQPIYIAQEEAVFDKGMPNIYTAAEHVDRAEANRMIEHYLSTLGVKNIKLKWDRPRYIVLEA